MEDPRETFLQAEAQAEQLVHQLTELKQKTEGHAKAEKSLEDVRASLVSMIDEISASSETVRSVVSKLGEIGTPEILEALGRVQEGISEASAQMTEGHSRLSEELGARLVRLERFVWTTLGTGVIIVIISVLILIRISQ